MSGKKLTLKELFNIAKGEKADCCDTQNNKNSCCGSKKTTTDCCDAANEENTCCQ